MKPRHRKRILVMVIILAMIWPGLSLINNLQRKYAIAKGPLPLFDQEMAPAGTVKPLEADWQSKVLRASIMIHHFADEHHNKNEIKAYMDAKRFNCTENTELKPARFFASNEKLVLECRYGFGVLEPTWSVSFSFDAFQKLVFKSVWFRYPWQTTIR